MVRRLEVVVLLRHAGIDRKVELARDRAGPEVVLDHAVVLGQLARTSPCRRRASTYGLTPASNVYVRLTSSVCASATVSRYSPRVSFGATMLPMLPLKTSRPSWLRWLSCGHSPLANEPVIALAAVSTNVHVVVGERRDVEPPAVGSDGQVVRAQARDRDLPQLLSAREVERRDVAAVPARDIERAPVWRPGPGPARSLAPRRPASTIRWPSSACAGSSLPGSASGPSGRTLSSRSTVNVRASTTLTVPPSAFATNTTSRAWAALGAPSAAAIAIASPHLGTA